MCAAKEESFKDTVTVLITALSDKENSVNDAIIKSLTKIASNYPNEVTEIFCDYYKNTSKVNSLQLANIIKVLEQTCVNQVKSMSPEVAKELVFAMLRAMTQNSDYEPAVQLGASSVLVAIGHVYLDLVLRVLIEEMSVSSVPHYTIPHTLGTLAAVNTHDTVPHIKEILSKMLPLLALVKVDGTRQAFAYAFGHFAVAVVEQIGDNVKNGNITAIKDNFVVEFSLIFDVLYNQWLHSHEPKVTESVLEALGPITRLISERKFDEVVNKFVLALLALYRKNALNCYYISQCISYLLTPSSLNPKLSLNDNVITSTNHTLFNLVILEPDYDQPHTVKNHFEVLRCFDHMAEQFPEPTVEGLLHQCKNNHEKERMKAVIVLTHLTTSSQIFVEKYASKFIAILKVMTSTEQSLKMKKLLVKAVVGLVYRNCIVSAEDFSMVEFIVKHCGYECGPNVSEEAYELQDTCKSSLMLMCNTVTSVRTQLRNLLLTSLTLEHFTASMSSVAHCLISILQNNPESTTEDQSSDKKFLPELIFIRSIIYLIDIEQVERNKNLLMFLEEYSGDIHKNLKNSWTVEVQRLLKFVEKNESTEQWQGMLIDLLVSAIEQVNSNKWTENISVALSDQILKTKQSPLIQGISLQYLAIVSCHLSNAAIVENVLQIIISTVKSVSMENSSFVSKAIGIGSRKHGEYIMNEIDLIYKDIDGKRSNKLLNFLTPRYSKTEFEHNIVKYVIITCYGAIASECLDVHVLARLGDNVTHILYEILKSSPNMDMCRAVVTTLYQICKAIQPPSQQAVVLRNRWQLLNAVLEQISNPNLNKRNIELYPIIVKASMALTKLQKGILPEERNTILVVLFNSIFGELATFKEKYETDGNGTYNDLLAKNLNDSLMLLHELIRELIIQSTCLSTIDDLVSLLTEWLHNGNDEIRIATVLILQVIFDSFIRNVKINYETPSKFGQMGYLLGLMLPGISDVNFQVRHSTLDCIKLIILIQDLYEGRSLEPDDKCITTLTEFHGNLVTNDLNMIADYCKTLCLTIYEKVPGHYTMQVIECLLEYFDNNEYCSTGVGAILETLFVKRGLELYHNVERIIEAVLRAMDRVADYIGRKLLPAVSSLGYHHSNAVTAVLLGQKLPLKTCVSACWRHLARDDRLSSAIIENFLRVMTSIELFEDPYHITENHIAALQPLTLITALGEMLEEEETSKVCIEKFPELFSILFTTVACYIDAESPAYSMPENKNQERLGYIPNRESIKLSPSKIATSTFYIFLLRADCQKLKEECSLWLSVESAESGGRTAGLAAALAAASGARPALLARLLPALVPYARSAPPPARAAVLAFCGDLLCGSCSNEVVLETVLGALAAGCGDEWERARAAAVRGVARVGRLPPAAAAAAHVPVALAALSRAVDAAPSKSHEDNVPLASMQGLSHLLTDIEKIHHEYDRELFSISQKIRPFMNTECPLLREHSIRLFGIITSKVKSESLVEQSITALPCFLLHLCDINPAVVRASKFTLKQVFKTLEVAKANELVQTHLVEEGRLFIEQFLVALLRLVADERPAALPVLLTASLNYLHTARDDIRPYPPLLIGLLFSELHRVGSPETEPLEAGVTPSARSRLAAQLRDAAPAVRRRAAAALASLCLYAQR